VPSIVIIWDLFRISDFVLRILPLSRAANRNWRATSAPTRSDRGHVKELTELSKKIILDVDDEGARKGNFNLTARYVTVRKKLLLERGNAGVNLSRNRER
jgi:hypothetical protein